MSAGAHPPVDISIVIPCLNEAETIASCVGKALRGIESTGLRGEVIVSDNGSTDGSPQIATDAGARVVRVERRGYGEALLGGIGAARGEFIVMGDADDSYDFLALKPFIERLQAGADMVLGCRLPSGGGRVMPGAMPLLHRYFGNPFFSFLARWWFRVPIHDINCGLRAFTRTLYRQVDPRCTGMEFAVELVLKAGLQGARIEETPITLHRDGRTAHVPHLRTFRDGWRTLRFYLLFSPRWLFLVPGLACIALGMLGYAVGFPGLSLLGATFGENTLLFASVAILCGWQSILFAIFAKTYAIGAGLLPADRRFSRFIESTSLERGIAFGAATLLAGVVLLGGAVNQWIAAEFGPLDYRRSLRWVIPGATLTALGVQTVLASFMCSILRLARR